MIQVIAGNRPPRPGPDACRSHLSDEDWAMIVQCWAQDPKHRPRMATVESRLCRLAGTLTPDPHRREVWQRRRSQQLASSTSEGLVGTLRHRQSGQSALERVPRLTTAEVDINNLHDALLHVVFALWAQTMLWCMIRLGLGTCLACFPRIILTPSYYTKGAGTPTTPMRADGDIPHTTTQTETVAEPAGQRQRSESLSPARTPGLTASEAQGPDRLRSERSRSPSPTRLLPRPPPPSSAGSHRWRMFLNNWLQRHGGVGRLSVEFSAFGPNHAPTWTAISRGQDLPDGLLLLLDADDVSAVDGIQFARATGPTRLTCLEAVSYTTLTRLDDDYARLILQASGLKE
jgi:hypothetical protein